MQVNLNSRASKPLFLCYLPIKQAPSLRLRDADGTEGNNTYFKKCDPGQLVLRNLQAQIGGSVSAPPPRHLAMLDIHYLTATVLRWHWCDCQTFVKKKSVRIYVNE